MRLYLIALLVVYAGASEETDRMTQAANYIIAAINTVEKAAPMIIDSDPILWGIKIIGGVTKDLIKYFESQENLKKQLSQAVDQMNQRFDQLERDVNDDFNNVEAFIDRKLWETDITDPSVILWGDASAYMIHPSNATYSRLLNKCLSQQPWKVTTKILNRVTGPNNTLERQLIGSRYDDKTFLRTAKVVNLRSFQMMMVQGLCLGVQHGADYNITYDWEMRRIQSMYGTVLSKIVNARKSQKVDYWNSVRTYVSNDLGQSGGLSGVSKAYNFLSSHYPWDRFATFGNLDNKGCNDHFALACRSWTTEMGSYSNFQFIALRGNPVSTYGYSILGAANNCFDCGKSMINLAGCILNQLPASASAVVVRWYESKCAQYMTWSTESSHNFQYYDNTYKVSWGCTKDIEVRVFENGPTPPDTSMHDLGFYTRPVNAPQPV